MYIIGNTHLHWHIFHNCPNTKPFFILTVSLIILCFLSVSTIVKVLDCDTTYDYSKFNLMKDVLQMIQLEAPETKTSSFYKAWSDHFKTVVPVKVS